MRIELVIVFIQQAILNRVPDIFLLASDIRCPVRGSNLILISYILEEGAAWGGGGEQADVTV